MPTYGYQCTQCQHEFSVFQNMKDDPVRICPECSGAVKRLMYPVGIVFKGSGWYINDSRKPDTTDSAEKTSDSTEKSDTSEKSEKSDKSETTDKSDKSDKSSSGEKPAASAEPKKPAADTTSTPVTTK